MRAHRIGILTATALAVATFGAAGEARAQRESGIQLSPGSTRYFISKDVGAERWAITYNLDDKTVTGNVFPQGGGAPTFLTCDITRVEQAANPADAQYFMDCRTAGPCANAPCTDQWGPPAPVGPIPGSFLLPTDTRSTLAGNVQPILTASCATSTACHASGAALVPLASGETWPNTFLVRATEDPARSYVDPFLPDVSFLMNKIEGTAPGGRMPLGGGPLPSDKQEAIRRWIVEGGANN